MVAWAWVLSRAPRRVVTGPVPFPWDRRTDTHVLHGTTYGRSRSSTKSFFRHHLAAISSAIVYQDAVLLANAAAMLAFQAFPRRPGAGSAP